MENNFGTYGPIYVCILFIWRFSDVPCFSIMLHVQVWYSHPRRIVTNNLSLRQYTLRSNSFQVYSTYLSHTDDWWLTTFWTDYRQQFRPWYIFRSNSFQVYSTCLSHTDDWWWQTSLRRSIMCLLLSVGVWCVYLSPYKYIIQHQIFFNLHLSSF